MYTVHVDVSVSKVWCVGCNIVDCVNVRRWGVWKDIHAWLQSIIQLGNRRVGEDGKNDTNVTKKRHTVVVEKDGQTVPRLGVEWLPHVHDKAILNAVRFFGRVVLQIPTEREDIIQCHAGSSLNHVIGRGSVHVDKSWFNSCKEGVILNQATSGLPQEGVGEVA